MTVASKERTPPTSPLVVGQVGLGYWGPNLARCLDREPRVRLKWLCDLDPARLAAVGKNCPGARTTSDVADLLADPETRAIVVSTPAATHHAIAKAALEAGKAVLVEKPLALSGADAADLARLAASRGLPLLVGHTFLHNTVVKRVKELIDAGDLGDVYYLHSKRVNLGRRQTDINAFWSIAPHDVSIFNLWLGASPVAVQAAGAAHLAPGVEDVVFATLFYPDGRLAHIHASWLDPAKERKITAVGASRMIVYDELDAEGRLKIYEQGAGPRLPGRFFGDYQTKLRAGDIHIPRVDYREPLAEEVARFASVVLDGAQAIGDARNGLEVVLVCEAVAESLRRGGARVEVPSAEELLGG